MRTARLYGLFHKVNRRWVRLFPRIAHTLYVANRIWGLMVHALKTRGKNASIRPATRPATRPAKELPVVKLIRKNPGLDSHGLVGAGWDYWTHGSLKVAEQGGHIRWTNGGWYVGDGRAKHLRAA